MPTHNNNIFVRPKKVCLLWEMCLFREMCLSWEMCLFRECAYFGKMCLFFENVLYFWKWRITHHSVLHYTISENNKKGVLSDSRLKKYRLFIFPKSSLSQNTHIFVRAKRMCLFCVCAYNKQLIMSEDSTW